MSKVARLRAAGFDRSEHVPFTKHHRVRCSQCKALVILGVPCHENGCPNIPRNRDEDES